MPRTGRPPIDDPRTLTLRVRLTETEQATLTAAAGDQPLSTWLRELGLAAAQEAAETPASSTGIRSEQ